MTVGEFERQVAGSLEELLAGATAREPLKHADSKSGATFERVVLDGTAYVVKVFERDWLADASDDEACRAVSLFERGVYDIVAGVVDHTVVGAARLSATGEGWPAALLMRDAGPEFIAEDAPVDLDTHAAFLEAMAALHALFWDGTPEADYMPFAVNYRLLSPRRAIEERDRCGDRSDVLRAVLGGWDEVRCSAEPVWALVADLLDDPARLVAALATTPATFLQGDWKMGNLGRRPDGMVLLVDWDRPSVGPPLAELAWYLSVNCDRLPESKEQSIARYRDALEHRGVETGSWWDEQLALTLLGAFLQLGWSKVGQAEEFGWWAAAAARARALMD
jgi:aminoglycoside phosphotransferase (APT) family kinase protein